MSKATNWLNDPGQYRLEDIFLMEIQIKLLYNFMAAISTLKRNDTSNPYLRSFQDQRFK